MGRDEVFTVYLHHDGIFFPSPLKYINGDEKQITDINFESMSYVQFRNIIKHLVHGIVYRLYYCPLKTPLNMGIRELKTDNDYDVLDFVNEEANGVISSGSSDEYYSSDECEEIKRVDFYTEGEENVGFIDGSVPQIEGDALKDPDDANIDPSCKVKKGVAYPKHDPHCPLESNDTYFSVAAAQSEPASVVVAEPEPKHNCPSESTTKTEEDQRESEKCKRKKFKFDAQGSSLTADKAFDVSP
ncbi:hypothetical protein Tco_1235015 [Tanacetum coccineum]